MTVKVNPDLERQLYDITKLELLPGNPNKGDVESMVHDLTYFGQMKAIVVKRLEHDETRGIVIAGNTTLKAARELGWDQIAVTWVEPDWDESKSLGFALADNRQGQKGEIDNEAVLEFIEMIDDPDITFAAGYDEDDIQGLLDGTFDVPMDIPPIPGEAPTVQNLDDEDDDDDVDDERPSLGNPVIQYTIIFSDEDQQQRWFGFVRWLKKKWPDEETVSDRLDRYLEDYVDEE